MAGKGKRFNKAREGLDANAVYALEEAVKMVRARAGAKFDESIDPPALASLNPFTLREAASTFAWDIGPIGGTQYNRVTVSGPAGRIMGNPFSASDGLAMIDMEVRCQNTSVSSLDDAFQILFN